MPEEVDHIAELEKRLYARDPEHIPERKYGILRPVKQSVESQWGETSIPHTKKTARETLKGYKRFFMFSLFFFLIAGGIALYSLYRGAATLSSKNVEVSLVGNTFVGAGEELPVQVAIANKNAENLEDVVLTLEYPKGAVDATGGELVRDKKVLGVVESGKTKSENFSVYLYGEQGTTHTITAHLEYTLGGASAVFIKESTFSVVVNTSPLSLSVTAPATVASNQTFTLRLGTVFSGDKPIENALLRVEYPNGYVYQSATMPPVSGNNVWKLGDLVNGSTASVEIQGKLVGEIQDEKVFRVYVGTPVSDTDAHLGVIYNSRLQSVLIEEPFISGRILIGQANAEEAPTSEVIALPIGSPVQGVVSWVNNSALSVASPEFTLLIDSPSVDFDSVMAEGAYVDELSRTITWNTRSSDTLSTLSPGTRGQFTFLFKELSGTTAREDIPLSLSVRGTFPDRDFAESSVNNIDQKVVRFASRLQFASEALYGAGPFKNTGPFPPKADQETTYTVTWRMLPVENALTQARAVALLPQGVVWGGVISPVGEDLVYSEDTRLITWNIGSLPKAAALSVSRTASFQIRVKPTKSQVGTELTLLGETTIQAKDAVAGVMVSLARPALSSRLITDPTYTPGEERVLP